MKKYTAEFIGTFSLVFCGTGAIIIDQLNGGVIGHIGIAITFGLVVMIMVYSFIDVSGAHINPAVTIGFLFAGVIDKKEALPYISAQLGGALLATGILMFMFPATETLGATVASGGVTASFFIEVVITFFLMLVILLTTQGSLERKEMAGLAIGATILMAAIFAGPVSGASLNPARSFSPALMSWLFTDLWIYLIAPPVGAILATVAWRAVR